MNILLIDRFSCYCDFVRSALGYGHSIRWFQPRQDSGEWPLIGRGLGAEMVREWEPSMKWADLVMLSTNTRYLWALETYRKKGFPIWGSGLEAAEWELDRGKGQAILAGAGIEVMESTSFTSLEKAKAHILANPRRWVSKPNADDCKELSYVSKSPADMVFMLDYWKRNSKVKGEFILQEFTPGIEVAVGGWFGPGGFSRYFCENFEHKKLMNGEIGVNTGEMGTVLKYTERSSLAEILLRPLEGELYRQGYTGFIDVSVMVNKRGTPLPLEFTMRPGWPLFQIQQALHKGDPAQWVKDSLDGRDTLKVSPDVSTGVVMTIPDFPYSTFTQKETSGYPVYGYEKLPVKDFHPAGMMWGNAPVNRDGGVVYEDRLVTAGDEVCIVTGTAPRVRDSRELAYAHLSRLEIPNSPMYRTDIGERVEGDLRALKGYGFCLDWRW